MKKRFIVLIDFSDHSENLIRYAYDLAITNDAELLLLHQLTIAFPALGDPETKKQFAELEKKKAMESLIRLAKEVVPTQKRVWYNVVENDLPYELSFLLKENYENLVFVGIKKVTTLKKLFFSNLALQLIDAVEIVIVAVPNGLTRFSHEKIFVAISEQYPLNRVELSKFLSLFDKENTQLIFFYLSNPGEETKGIEKILKQEADYFSEDFQTLYKIYQGEKPLDDIKKVINNQIEEILVVQKGSRLLTDQLFRKFVINELVNDGQTPMVVLPI